MYDGMRSTSPGSAIYFLFIIVIGNYVVLNLFLAILLDNFAGGGEDEDPSLQNGSETRANNMRDGDLSHVDSGADPEDEEETRAAWLLTIHVCNCWCIALMPQAAHALVITCTCDMQVYVAVMCWYASMHHHTRGHRAHLLAGACLHA
jgi:Ion transport protein